MAAFLWRFHSIVLHYCPDSLFCLCLRCSIEAGLKFSIVVKFAKHYNLPLPTRVLEMSARNSNWMSFLVLGQIYHYPQSQVPVAFAVLYYYLEVITGLRYFMCQATVGCLVLAFLFLFIDVSDREWIYR